MFASAAGTNRYIFSWSRPGYHKPGGNSPYSPVATASVTDGGITLLLMYRWMGTSAIVERLGGKVNLFGLTFFPSPLTGFLAIDPVKITNPEKVEDAVYKAFVTIKARLYYVGICDYEQAIVANKKIISYLKNHLYKLDEIRFIADNYVPPGTIFILTKKGEGRLFIHPPYLKNGDRMSWGEYFNRIAKGETMSLKFDAPWAQAIIDGVNIND